MGITGRTAPGPTHLHVASGVRGSGQNENGPDPWPAHRRRPRPVGIDGGPNTPIF